MSAEDLVLVSWIAAKHDPFERNDDGTPRFVDGQRVPGPTLVLLTDPTSECAGHVTDAVILRQGGREETRHQRRYEELVEALSGPCPTIRLHPHIWQGEDPTDHGALFEFLREKLPQIRRKFSGRELVIHISPGTPSMQTVWVLMAETGFIEPPFKLVKSIRPEHRRGGPALAPVKVGIDTFYKRYQATRPAKAADGEQLVRWNPTRFQSAKLKDLFTEARRIARLKIPVLLLGERGTGKTTLAGWIRASSPYRKAELDTGWAAVACGQYGHSDTLRAELFGYRKGAFTGADRDREGLLHAASGDTLFLDEIGDVSRDVQRMLIKAIEEGRFQRMGSTKVETSDFRLVTATNLGLDELGRRLDADFFDRIRAHVLRVPALREIPDDLGWLWDATLEEAARRACVSSRWIALSERERSRLVSTLKEHSLPGNIRDLFRVAWRFLAARADDDAPLSPSDAVSYALGALEAPGISGDVQARAIAKAFAEGAALAPDLVEQGPIQTDSLFGQLRDYLGRELPRLAKEAKRPLKEVADVSDRSLREWRRKSSSGDSEP